MSSRFHRRGKSLLHIFHLSRGFPPLVFVEAMRNVRFNCGISDRFSPRYKTSRFFLVPHNEISSGNSRSDSSFASRKLRCCRLCAYRLLSFFLSFSLFLFLPSRYLLSILFCIRTSSYVRRGVSVIFRSTRHSCSPRG